MQMNWKADAREYGRIAKKGGWWLAYLAARNVAEGTGGPRVSTVSIETVSARQFAEEAGTSPARVLRHLEAWDRAADAGVVPSRKSFVGTDHNVPMPDDEDNPFTDWYTSTSDSGRNVTGATRRDALIAQANKDGVGASKVLDVASNKKAVVAALKADPTLARAIANDIDATLAVDKQRSVIADEQGIRDPAAIERDRERRRLAESGPGMVEILEWGNLAGKAAEVARKFVTPDSGPGEYRDNARIQIEAANTKFRNAVQHVEDVMNGNVDTRIPDDISALVNE